MPQTKLDIIVTAKDRASGAFSTLGRKLNMTSKATAAANKAMTGLKIAMGAGLAFALKDGIEKAVSFDKAMRNVDSIAKLSGGDLASLSEKVRGLSMQSDILFQSSTTLAEGLYDVYSSGFEGELALKVLETSAKGAGAGLTETATSARALMAIMNAYNRKTGKDAESIMDVLFKTVDKGVITFEELSGSIGEVVSTSSAAKIPIETIGAAIATLTKKGVNAAESTVWLNQMITRLLDPTTEMTQALKHQGYESGLTAIQSDGLSKVLNNLWQESDESVDSFIKLWGNVRAGKAALSLASDGGKMFTEDLRTMGDAAGSTQAAIERQSQSTAAQYDQLMKKADNLKMKIANQLLPVALNAMKAFEAGLRTLTLSALPPFEQASADAEEELGKIIQDFKAQKITAPQAKAAIEKLKKPHRDLAKAARSDADANKSVLMALWNLLAFPVDKLKAHFSKARTSAGGNGGLFGGLIGKQIGGQVTSGSPYMVGERGPELFVPAQSGMVVPNSKLGGGVTVNIYGNINNREGLTPQRISQMIGREIELSMQGAR